MYLLYYIYSVWGVALVMHGEVRRQLVGVDSLSLRVLGIGDLLLSHIVALLLVVKQTCVDWFPLSPTHFFLLPQPHPK